MWLVLALPGCGRSQETQLRDAISAKFPDGVRRCLGLSSDVVGIHAAGGPRASAFFYSGNGPTDPLRRSYVFYAGFVDAPLPELVGELAAAGKLHRSAVDAIVDVEEQGPGREVVSPATGFRERPIVYRHEVSIVHVAIFETIPQDPDFAYTTRFFQRGGFVSPVGGFPSKMYPGPLPPVNTHYQVPTVEPYATNIVAQACFPEAIDGVSSIRKVSDWSGIEHVEADVAFVGRPPAWMSTPAFRCAAMGPDTAPLDAPRRVTILFDVTDGRLAYARELPR